MKTIRIITPTGHLVNHVIEVADPRELFRTRFETIRADGPASRP